LASRRGRLSRALTEALIPVSPHAILGGQSHNLAGDDGGEVGAHLARRCWAERTKPQIITTLIILSLVLMRAAVLLFYVMVGTPYFD
jgi:hypothetical protein